MGDQSPRHAPRTSSVSVSSFYSLVGGSTQAWGAGRAGSHPAIRGCVTHTLCARLAGALFPGRWGEASCGGRWRGRSVGLSGSSSVNSLPGHMEIQGPSEGAGLPVAALPCGSPMSPLLPQPGCQTRMGVSQGPRELGFVRASEHEPCTAWQEARDPAEITGPLSW